MEIRTEEELFKCINRSMDDSTLFCKIRNALNTLLEVANMAENAELLNIYHAGKLKEIENIVEQLDENYEKFYDIFEKTLGNDIQSLKQNNCCNLDKQNLCKILNAKCNIQQDEVECCSIYDAG